MDKKRMLNKLRNMSNGDLCLLNRKLVSRSDYFSEERMLVVKVIGVKMAEFFKTVDKDND